MPKRFLKIRNEIWYVIFLVVLAFFYILLQNASINLKVRKKLLQQEIEQLKSREILIQSKLMQLTLEGNIEKELKENHINLEKSKLPKVIFIEKNDNER